MRTTLLIVYAFPRSTLIHASSEKFDDQRVPLFPSKAYLADVPSASEPEASAVPPFATFTPLTSGSSFPPVEPFPYTSISQIEYPYGSALVTPCIFTYLASVAVNVIVSTPPFPSVTFFTVVQLFPSTDVCIL